MKLSFLKLRNYRNITETEFKVHPRFNLVLGSNGQGKTSILEAIHLLGSLKSFRGAKMSEMIQWGQELSEIQGTLGFEAPETLLKITLTPTQKAAFVNGKAFRSSTQYLSQRFGDYRLGFHSVVFNPSDHDLVRGDPGGRRSYLDRVIAAEDLQHLEACTQYQRVLDQRNAVLKGSKTQQTQLLLEGFSEALSQTAAKLTLNRLNWIRKAQKDLDNTLRYIAPSQPVLSLVYISNWVPEIAGLCLLNRGINQVHFAGQDPLPSLDQIQRSFWQKLSALGEAERRSGHSLVGPHRDDWSLMLGNQFLKGHGSQGEVRSALLALKLCEIDLFQQATGHRPLFLLDDFSSELDRFRRKFLVDHLLKSDLQVFISTTEDFTEDLKDAERVWIDQGKRVCSPFVSENAFSN